MEKKALRKFYYFAIIILVFVLLILALNIFLNRKLVLDEKEFDVSLNITDTMGFDLSSRGVLNFGNVVPGNSATRWINIDNNYEFPIEVVFYSEGDVSSFLSFEDSIYLGVGESKHVSVNAIVPANEKVAEYSGKLFAVIKGS